MGKVPQHLFNRRWRLKESIINPFKPTFTIGLANGWGGYLPTPEQHEVGGYETWLSVNKVEKNATRKIVAELLTLFSKLK